MSHGFQNVLDYVAFAAYEKASSFICLLLPSLSFGWLANSTINIHADNWSVDIRTLRASLAVLAAVLLVVVLTLLIVESRAVKDEYYVSHAERMRAIESTEIDIAAVVGSMRNAFEEGRAIPLSVDSAFARLIDNSQLVRSYSDVPRLNPAVQSQLENFDDELHRFVRSGQAFAERQNTLAESLQALQQESPLLVKDLRADGLGDQARHAFSLAIGIIEFATGQKDSDPKQLADRIEELRSDSGLESRAPGRVNAFIDAAKSVIEKHSTAETALHEVNQSVVAGELSSLTRAILDDNRRTVSRAERARALLSVCAVLLLFAAGYAIFQLQASYRELNQSNAKLERANATLEERVVARTEELSRAYDELKESQVQLVQAEKMSSLGEMVAGISHEINTPLWYLMSNSSVIQERLDAVGELCDIAESMIASVQSRSSVKETISSGLIDMHRLMNGGMKEDIDEAKDLIQDSIDGLEELTVLAQSLKDFSRLDRARQGLFNVNEGLDKSLLIAKNKIKHKATVHKHYGDVPLIHCSPSQINQIFLNLLTNASDAIAESGEIVLHTCEDNGNVEISIADTGSGIPADVLPKVRDPFFTTKEVGKGTGLGLSIVDQIITAHGGELRIESEAGKGTTVTVALPIAATGFAAIEEDRGDIAA